MAEGDDEDKHLFVADRIDDAVVPRSHPEQVRPAGESLDARRTRFDGKLVDEGGDAATGISAELAKLAPCGGTKFDLVGRAG
jgi:hypothetical protein